jgi:hypothetical protein
LLVKSVNNLTQENNVEARLAHSCGRLLNTSHTLSEQRANDQQH